MNYNPFGKEFFYAIGFIVVIFGLLLLSKPASPAPLSELPKIGEEMFLPSVQLDKNCSGTIIYSDRDKISGKVSTMVLTAKHCTESLNQDLEIFIYDYNKSNRLVKSNGWTAKVWGQSYKSDLALIKLVDDNTIFKTAKIAPRSTGESLIFGQDVFSVSYPLGGSMTFTQGTLGRVENLPYSSSKEFYRSTPDIAPGSSGSGLFQNVTGDYELIGTLTAGYRHFSFMNLYTPIEEIHDYLDVAKLSYEVKK